MDLLEKMILGVGKPDRVQEMILMYSGLPTHSESGLGPLWKTLLPEMREELSTLPEETKRLYRDRILTFLERHAQTGRRMLEILDCLSPTPLPTRVD